LLAACRDGKGSDPGTPRDGGGTTDGSATPDGAAAPLTSVGKGVPVGRQINHLWELEPLTQLDLLFMIDNSSSMAEEQNNLARNFPALIRMLETTPGGMPDVHIGIISSSFGAGPGSPSPECSPLGDRGRLMVKPGCGLDPAVARFLSIDAKGNKNFTGDLNSVFACLAALGTNGCGYEHQLQAVRAALADNVNPENRGFLRRDAILGIILVTDEDDCSAEPDATIFDTPRPGEASNLRCATLGHVCNGQPVPAQMFGAPLTSCAPYERGNNQAERRERLINVGEFVEYLKSLKGRPDRIFVSAIMGWDAGPSAQYRIDPRTVAGASVLDLSSICSSANGEAAPGIRLKAFVEGFGQNGIFSSICQADFRPALVTFGEKLGRLLSPRCLTGPLFDTDEAAPGMQADCKVTERRPTASGGYADVPVPPCGGGASLCWTLVADPACPSEHRVELKRDAPPVPATLLSIACRGRDGSQPGCVAMSSCGMPVSPATHGQMCDVGAATVPPLPPHHALWRGDAPDCPDQLCLLPARDIQVAMNVDTSPLCTRACVSDADCINGDMRNPYNQIDKRCRSGFACAVPFEVGPLRCQKLCTCKDFLIVPPGGLTPPASCAASP
jgi:hypothetical protein